MKVGAVINKRSLAVQGRIKLLASEGQTLQTGMLRNQEHVIVPCVMIVEGVLHSSNASEPALALSSEFGAIPQGWDGRPVVYNHPIDSESGDAVSANRPEGWESDVIGMLFNTELDGQKLKSDLWLDTSRSPEVLIQGLRDGQEFEVSTGLFALIEEKTGVFNNKRYSQIWRNIVPDHLAILEPGSIGACSIADGCGALRRNSALTQEVYMNSPAQTRVEPASSLAQSKNNDDLLAASAAGDCGCGGKPSGPALVVENLGIAPRFSKMFQSMVSKLGNLFKTNELSDNDRRTAIQAGLDSIDEQFAYPNVYAVFASYVVFTAMSRDDYDWHMYKLSYSVAEGGAITIGTDLVEVRPETSFVPVVVEGSQADDAVLAASTSSTPELKETNMDLSKEQLAAIAAQLQANGLTIVANSAAPATATPTEPAPVKTEPLANLEAVVKASSPELGNQIKDALEFVGNARKQLTDILVKNGFTEAELSSISTSVLRRMATQPAANASANANANSAPTGTAVVDFSALGATQSLQSNAQPAYTPPTPMFTRA